jgi:hypothetical protein
MADIPDLSKLDELDIATLEMDKRDIILRCLYENWPDEVSMIGDDLVTRIVDDALLGIRTPIRRGQGGFNFDLTPYIEMIISGAGLLVAIVQFYMTLPTPPEDPVKKLTQFLIDEMKVEPGKATKLARAFIRIIIRISSNGR